VVELHHYVPRCAASADTVPVDVAADAAASKITEEKGRCPSRLGPATERFSHHAGYRRLCFFLPWCLPSWILQCATVADTANPSPC
jgi:hypothetical protein